MSEIQAIVQEVKHRAINLADALARLDEAEAITTQFTRLETELADLSALVRSARLLSCKQGGDARNRSTKRAHLIDRLSSAEGATRDELLRAYEWKPKTLSAVLSGLKRDGFVIKRERDLETGQSRYRIE